MNIGRKLMLSFLLVTLVPTILLALLSTLIISKNMKVDAQVTVSNSLKAARVQYYARAHQMKYGMLQASTESYIKRAIAAGDTGFLRSQLKAWKKYRPHVDLWNIVDKNARIIASLNSESTGNKVSINGLVERAITSGVSVISTELIDQDLIDQENLTEQGRVLLISDSDEVEQPEYGVLSGGMLLVVVTPVMNEADTVVGAIITGDLTNNDTFVPDSFADTIPGSLVSISMGGVQVATNVRNEEGGRAVGHLYPSEVLDKILSNEGFRGETVVAGSSYMAAFDPITNYRDEVIGALFVGVPKERFVELQNENIKAVIAISTVALFLATGVASLITLRIIRPIKALNTKAELISSGDLNIGFGFPTEGNDEIADLAETFKQMVRNLSENEERIQISQDNLSHQKNLVESIINSLPYCLYVIGKDLKIVDWNRHGLEECPICKATPGLDCYGADFVTHLGDFELREGLKEVVESVFKTGKPVSLERRVSQKGPGSRDLRVQSSIFPILSAELTNSQRPVEYVIWMAEDVTARREMEARVISSEKLAAVGQLAAGVAHEVNNPLGGVLNCIYNFKNRNLTDERKTEYIDFIEDGITRAQNIVRQLLDFSQQHDPELARVDINSLIESVLPLIHHSIKGRDINVVTRLGTDLPDVLADRHQIEQVLVNLLLNAVQSVEQVGRIEVATSAKGGWYSITIGDNGCGIEADSLNRIFDPFYTTKGVGSGTGLGLSVSRGIIERHKGRIEVESTLRVGTTFKLYLPVILPEPDLETSIET
ncbi:MAG: cache domain-containing protein [Proteobacteria bacterium]|nr:cache domain-containing protein [Pseudomonadota bacterium]